MTLSDVNSLVFEFLASVVALLMQPPLFWFIAVAIIFCGIAIVIALIRL